MIALRSSIISLALCSLFASSVVRADDCGDALVAESCACRSPVANGPEQVRRSKGSSSDRKSEAKQSVRMERGRASPDPNKALSQR
jgi:hypothetical protein